MKEDKFLYNIINQEFGKRSIESQEIPNSITENLKHEIRPYQKEAFARFLLCYENSFEGRPSKPFHLLFNMATGSGKTMVMAGLMLYLYEKGYRNFLFFVNSTNVIEKTKENFLNSLTSKYLFKERIMVEGKSVEIKEVENFEEADEENINIKFTTIQALHTDLTNPKENSVTFEDFADKKIVLLADEAHSLNATTKSKKKEEKEEAESWEKSVLKILEQNKADNLLLEFTATVDWDNNEIKEKYKDKILYRYDLKAFRNDGYSKEISLIRSELSQEDRILQALVLNLYRQLLATKHGIDLKPVILFKAKKTIAENQENKEKFHKQIEKLEGEDLERLSQNTSVPVVQEAFRFFKRKNMSWGYIAQRIQEDFREENCLSANDTELEKKSNFAQFVGG